MFITAVCVLFLIKIEQSRRKTRLRRGVMTLLSLWPKLREITYSSLVAHYGSYELKNVIIHQTHYEKSDWSRAFNQFTIAFELDIINAISAAGIEFIMSNSTSAWLLSPLECSSQKLSEDELCEKCIINNCWS